jgi:bla regulator protein blaR1
MNSLGGDFSWVQALGWSLIYFLWQGALVGVLYALVRALLPKQQSSARYALGLLALAGLVVCPFVTFFLLWSATNSEVTTLGNVLVVTSQQGASLVVGPEAGFDGWLPLLVVGWLVGVALMIGRAAHQWRTLERIATRLAWRQVEIEEMLVHVARRFGALPGARVLVSACIDTPTLIGWFKPIILLPAAVVAGFPRQQLELILAHELGHLRRYDHLVNLGQAVIETLLFYHPVVHWISREVRHEREVCCDNLVLRLTDSEPREYARTLAALEDVRQLTPQLAVAASGGMLLDRVRRIIGAGSPRNHNRRSILGVWMVAATCSLLLPAIWLMSRTGSEDSPELTVLAQVVSAPGKPSIDLSISHPIAETPRFAQLTAPERPLSIDVAETAENSTGSGTRDRSDDRITPEFTAPSIDAVVESPALAMDVGNLEMARSPLALESPLSVGTALPVPVLLRRISPEYPDGGFVSQHAIVGFEFSIDDAGNVRNIHAVSGDRQGSFATAARNALRDWKFDPGSVQGRQGEKFHQDFEFVSKTYIASQEADGSCTPPTGTHVCRPGRGAGAAARSESPELVASAAGSSTLADESGDSELACVPQTGSRFCRTGAGASVSMKVRPDEATAAHTIILAGGPN